MIRSWSRCQVHQKSKAAGIPVKIAVAIAAMQPTMISFVSSELPGFAELWRGTPFASAISHDQCFILLGGRLRDLITSSSGSCSPSRTLTWLVIRGSIETLSRKYQLFPLSKPSCERFVLRFVRKSVGLSQSMSNRFLILLVELTPRYLVRQFPSARRRVYSAFPNVPWT